MNPPDDLRAPQTEQELAAFLSKVSFYFNHAFYFVGPQTWQNTRWMGVPILKTPTDMWVYQEILRETQPTLVVETGTAYCGSALFLAQVGALACPAGVRVVTVDITNSASTKTLVSHPAITYLTGSSTDPQIVEQIRAHVRPSDRVMVVLDSDHSAAHVKAELDLYSPLVTSGCYLIVEDTNVNGHPVYPLHGPGPMEALDQFLPAHPEFEIDASREKYMLTFNPRGYLRRR